MILVNEKISLQEISNSDTADLFNLMKEVYPQAYDYFWQDGGNWYVNTQYSEENISKELLEENAEYFFVLYNGEKIGNFRIIWDKTLDNYNEKKKSVKLHRIYLHSKIQGKGVGKKLLEWLESTALQKQYELIWLDAMDEKPQAFQFYKKVGYQYHSHCFLPFDLLHDRYRKMSQVYKLLV